MATRKKTPRKATKKTRKGKAAGNKTKSTAKSVTAFLNAVDSDRRREDAKAVLAMMKKVTGEKPKMWGPSIVGFGEYHYVYESGREGDMFCVGFSPRKANLVLYVMGSIADDDPLRDRLGKYKTGKSCLYVNKLEDVDTKVLRKIIAKSYRATIDKWGRQK